MKIHLEKQDLEEIASMVLEKLKPHLINNDKTTDNELLTVEEVAKYLKVKKSFIYEKIQRKQIPFKKVGKFPRFRRKLIDKWMKNPYSPELEMNNSNLSIGERG